MKLFISENGKDLLKEVGFEEVLICRGATIEQMKNIASQFTIKYDTVELIDNEREAFLRYHNKKEKPILHVRYPEEEWVVAKKFGIKLKKEEDYVDLEAEKWANYYGDFNQCGIIIERN